MSWFIFLFSVIFTPQTRKCRKVAKKIQEIFKLTPSKNHSSSTHLQHLLIEHRTCSALLIIAFLHHLMVAKASQQFN